MYCVVKWTNLKFERGIRSCLFSFIRKYMDLLEANLLGATLLISVFENLENNLQK